MNKAYNGTITINGQALATTIKFTAESSSLHLHANVYITTANGKLESAAVTGRLVGQKVTFSLPALSSNLELQFSADGTSISGACVHSATTTEGPVSLTVSRLPPDPESSITRYPSSSVVGGILAQAARVPLL